MDSLDSVCACTQLYFIYKCACVSAELSKYGRLFVTCICVMVLMVVGVVVVYIFDGTQREG